MEDNEIRKVKMKFWIYLILSYIGLNELRDMIPALYEIYLESGSKFNLITGSIMALFWIAFVKSTITSTIREFKILRDFKRDRDIQNEDENDKRL